MKALSAVCTSLVVGMTLTPDRPAAALDNMLSHGTGFFVTKNGQLLTNFHVVESCRRLTIQSGRLDGAARVVALDPANDLALLATDLRPARIADWRHSVRDGEPVVAYGFPLGPDRAANGTVLGLTGWHNSKLLYLEAGVEPGMSGGPIIDRSGRVIGVNVGEIGNPGRKIGRATGAAAAAALLDANRIAHAEASDGRPLPAADVIEKAKAISAKVICHSNVRLTDGRVCRRSGGVSVSDDMIIEACSREIASGKFGGEALRTMYSQRANSYFRKHQYDRAKSDCDDALKIAHNDGDNLHCLAKIDAAKGEHDRAIAQLGEAIQLFPRDIIGFFMRAGAYLGKGDFGRAIADLDQAIQIDPDYAGAIGLRATIFDRTREHARALADFDRAITIYDEWIRLYALPVNRTELLTQRGNAYNAKGDRDHAIADFDEAIRLDHDNANAFFNRGTAYYAKSDRDHAIADFDQAVRLDPNHANAFNNRGNAYNAQGDRDRAIADYDQAIRLDPNHANAFYNRGTVYFAKGERDHAIADLDQAIRLDPSNANAFNNRGNAYNAKGDRDHAIADLDQAIRLDPNHANAFYNRGNAYYAKGDRDRAIADFDQAIRLDPGNANAFNNRGNAYNAKGDRDRAIADLDQAIRLDPNRANAFYNRGNAYYAKGDRDRAIADYERAIQINPAFDTALVRQRRNEAP